jgi:hypothetical protein
VSPARLQAFKRLEEFTDSRGNFRVYRARLAEHLQTGVACLPFLGVYLRDLAVKDEVTSCKNEQGINYQLRSTC